MTQHYTSIVSTLHVQFARVEQQKTLVRLLEGFIFFNVSLSGSNHTSLYASI